MNFIFAAIVALAPPLAFAQTETATTGTSASMPLDLPDFSHLQQQPPEGKGPQISVDMSCKTDDGQNFTASQPGFDTCVASKKGKAQ